MNRPTLSDEQSLGAGPLDVDLYLSSDYVIPELEALIGTLERWRTQFGNGIPRVEAPGRPESLHAFVRLFSGEMMALSDRAQSLSIRFAQIQNPQE